MGLEGRRFETANYFVVGGICSEDSFSGLENRRGLATRPLGLEWTSASVLNPHLSSPFQGEGPRGGSWTKNDQGKLAQQGTSP